MILGIIALVAGAAAAFYGNSLNTSPAAVLEDLLKGGSGKPGDLFLYSGIVVAIIGAVLVLKNVVKKKDKE